MLIALTNTSSNPVDVPAAGKTLAAGETYSFSRTQAQYDAETGLKELVTDGTLMVTFTAEPTDAVPLGMPDASGMAGLAMIRVVLPDGTGGSPEDVVVFDGNAPFEMRLMDCTLMVSTAVGGATVTVRDAMGGGGSALSDALSGAATGVVRNVALMGTTTVAEGGSLVVRKSDGDIVGEMLIMVCRA